MTILVVFGSDSDRDVYGEVCKELGKGYELRIISAHKTPDELDSIKFEDYSIIIAGAGLAAHLPGVVASKTIKPVIGVPCKQNYEGLDALLSIVQMPPGIPVLGVGVNRGRIAAQNALKMLKVYEGVNVIGDKHAEKAISVLRDFKVKAKKSDFPDANCVNIHFVPLDEDVKPYEGLVIYCPVLVEGDAAEAALSILRHSHHGLWVGANNAENAAIASINILNIKGEYTSSLMEYRGKKADKVRKADETARNENNDRRKRH
ncbi:AIR carboxylase family protein [Candidatus Woesearchaeota archaeon]|nr:AIR carboxylase family protein [Candidatus Woesearchaeota archaeon]